MKKLNFLLFFWLLAFTINAQQNASPTCAGSPTLSNGSNPNLSQYQSDGWFTYVPTSSSVSFSVTNNPNNPTTNVSYLELYTGNCSSPVLVATDTLTGPNDSTLYLSVSGLHVGENYFIQLYRKKADKNMFEMVLSPLSLCDMAYYLNYNANTVDPLGNTTPIGGGQGQVDGYCNGNANSPACNIFVCNQSNFILVPGNFNSTYGNWQYYYNNGSNSLAYNIIPSVGPSFTLAADANTLTASLGSTYQFVSASVPLSSYPAGTSFTIQPTNSPNTCAGLVITTYSSIPGTVAPNPANICVGGNYCGTYSTSLLAPRVWLNINNANGWTTNTSVNIPGAPPVPNYYNFCTPPYNTPGTYIGSVTASQYSPPNSSQAQCKTVYPFTVTVSSPAGPITAFSSANPICSGQSATLSASTSSGTANYTWNPGNVTGNPIVVTPTANTVYTVSAGGSGCPTRTAVVTVNVGNCCLAGRSAKNLSGVTIVAPGASTLNWGMLQGGQTYSGPIALPNSNYVIQGVYNVIGGLTINTPVTFSNTNMAFDEAVLVDQTQPVTITNSYWHGCTYMWKGIRSRSNLTITKSIVEDAANAVFVWVNNHPGVFLTNNIFNLNLNVVNFVGVSFQTFNNIPQFDCYGNIFTCRFFPATLYPNAYNQNSVWVTSVAPNLTTYPINFIKGSSILTIPGGIRSGTGINASATSNATNIRIGQVFNSQSQNALSTNYFDFIDYGVKNVNSKVTIFNAVFQNSPIGTGQAGIYHGGGITNIGGAPSGNFNKYLVSFLNSRCGVFATGGGTLTSVYNNYNRLFRGNDVESFSAASSTVSIQNNLLTNCDQDLYAFGNNPNATITFSINTAQGPYTGNRRHHIYINELAQASSAVYNINANTLSGKEVGAFMQNVKNSFVQNNTIANAYLTNNANLTYNGIELNNVANSRITDNSISCSTSGASGLTNVTGINSNICVNNIYACNTIFNTGVCLKYSGPCPSNIWKNQLNVNNNANPSKYGIWINSSGSTGSIGIPYLIPSFPNPILIWGRGDNEFGDFNYGNSGYDTYASNNSNTSNNLTIYWDGLSGGASNPSDPFSNGVLPNTNSFAYGKTVSAIPFPLPCGSFSGLITNSLQANNQSIPPFFGNSLNFGSNTQQSLFNARRGILELLKTQAINTASMQGASAFVTSNAGSVLGQFYLMDSLVVTQNTANITAAINQNGAISPNIITEQTQKDYNSLYHNFALTGSLTAQELVALTNLAQMCPFTDGSAIYQARALLTRFDSTEYINPCEYTVGQGSGNRFMNPAEKETVNSDVAALSTLVYPNPASNVLNISTELEGASITIYNVTGQIVLSEKLTHVTVLNIERLMNGSYLYKLTDSNNKTFKTDKLLINK